MSTPTKKRKRDVSESSGPRNRSIASFFQNQTAAEKSLGHTEQTLSDEALARRLQAEWNREEDANSAFNAGAANNNSPTSAPPIPDDDDSRPAIKEPTKKTLSLQSSVGTEDTVSLAVPLDQSSLTFDSRKYGDELRSHWATSGGDASYALLTRAFVLANATTSRIRIVDTFVNFLRVLIEGDPSSILPAVWLATNSISPPYDELELGLGGSSISKALKKIYGLNSQGLKTLYDKHGDAGDVAFEAKKKQSFTLVKPKPLKIKGVYQSLIKIATSKGSGSQEIKQRIVEKLLQDARGAEESRYIVRTLVQNLRIGAVKTTMLIALARAFLYSKPDHAKFSVHSRQELASLKKEDLAEIYSNAEEIVKASYARHPSYNDLVPCLLEIGITEELLLRCGLQLHVPLRPMLGSITRDLPDMLTKLQGRDFSCEFKYDGQRAQVHCDPRGNVTIFSRHLENMTEKYPDLVSLVPQIRGEGVSSFILEGEVVAVDQETGELQAFQTLTNRAKKNVDIGAIKVSVCLFSFDLMYLNGEPLLDRSFRERRELLRGLFVETPNRFMWVKSLDATSGDSDMVLDFFKNATDSKCEGIMVKVLDNEPTASTSAVKTNYSTTKTDASQPPQPLPSSAPNGQSDPKPKGNRRKALLSTYEPDKRLESWLKVKKDYNASSETLDLIPIAGWHGQGRKSKWWSPILLAVRNPETGSLEAVTKCMSGFTDKFYQANKDKYVEGSPNVISRPSYVEYAAGEPDVWFEPQEVWEMAFADITLSPTYPAAIGLVSNVRGLSLRFPRFLKVREDKSLDEATTSDELALLWRKQSEHRRLETELEMPETELGC